MEKRFRTFWVSFHQYALDYGQDYPSGYLHQLDLPRLFDLRNLQPVHANTEVREAFVYDLHDHLKKSPLRIKSSSGSFMCIQFARRKNLSRQQVLQFKIQIRLLHSEFGVQLPGFYV